MQPTNKQFSKSKELTFTFVVHMSYSKFLVPSLQVFNWFVFGPAPADTLDCIKAATDAKNAHKRFTVKWGISTVLARPNIRDVEKGAKSRATLASLRKSNLVEDPEKVCKDLFTGEEMKKIDEVLLIDAEDKQAEMAATKGNKRPHGDQQSGAKRPKAAA